LYICIGYDLRNAGLGLGPGPVFFNPLRQFRDPGQNILTRSGQVLFQPALDFNPDRIIGRQLRRPLHECIQLGQ
jgi:hypothetical protein